MSQSFVQSIDGLPAAERAALSHKYSTWYNLLLQLYKKDFAIKDNDDCKREFRNEDEVIVFFRAALLWWYKKKPVLGSTVTPLDAMKTWTCLGQIASLERRLRETGIPIDRLKINEHLHADAEVVDAVRDGLNDQ